MIWFRSGFRQPDAESQGLFSGKKAKRGIFIQGLQNIGTSPRAFSAPDMFSYVQDDLRVNPTLTLNTGARVESFQLAIPNDESLVLELHPVADSYWLVCVPTETIFPSGLIGRFDALRPS